jgi:hypothetical protein
MMIDSPSIAQKTSTTCFGFVQFTAEFKRQLMNRLLSLKFVCCLIASLSFFSGFAQPARCRLLHADSIKHFPSSSAIVYHQKKLFVIGDDSRDVMVLDRGYRKIDSMRIFDVGTWRVGRMVKTDIESAVILGGRKKKIFLIGSGSSSVRKKILVVPLRKKKRKEITVIDMKRFYDSLPDSIGLINIEGAFLRKNEFVLGNRRGLNQNNNFLITVAEESFLSGNADGIRLKKILTPDSVKPAPGISDLHMVRGGKTLLITFSSEQSESPLEDGAIGDSYLGWIKDIDSAMSGGDLRLDGMINLTKIDPAFGVQKIEGVCSEKGSGGKLIVHLVSDNDDGKSRIFKVELSVE